MSNNFIEVVDILSSLCGIGTHRARFAHDMCQIYSKNESCFIDVVKVKYENYINWRVQCRSFCSDSCSA